MIQLVLSTASTNLSRYYPHSGYLGLTPCIVQGVVHVKRDEQSKSIPAKSLVVSVRCYESRRGPVNVLYTNIIVEHSITLWTKSPDVSAIHISDSDYPFKITIPIDSPGFSTANFQDYKLSWRLEAVLEHIPLVGVGSRIVKHFELPLIRYDNPSVPPVPRLSMSSPINLHSAKLRAPIFRYNLSTPTFPIGPEDIVSTIIYLHPVDPLVVVRCASLIIERRIKFNRAFNQRPSSPPLDHLQSSWPQDLSTYDSYPSDGDLTALPLSSSTTTITPADLQSTSSLAISETDSNYTARPLLSHSPGLPTMEPSKVITNTIVSTDAVDFAHDSSGMWTKTITVQWPPRKRHSWATGETLTSEMASVRFYIRIRLSVSSPSTGSESIELVERELTVVSTNDSERRLALSHITPRSKSKSPKLSTHEAPEQSPSQSQPFGSKSPSSKSSAHGSSSIKVKSKTPRRPHTSAGPRDKSNLPYSAAPEVGLSSNPGNKVRLVSSNRNHLPTPEMEFRRDSMRSSRPRQSGEVHASHIHGRVRIPSDHIRDWETELARIETESRRSSADMLGFWGGNKRKSRTETPERNRSL